MTALKVFLIRRKVTADMSLITQLRDQKDALDYLESELGEDNPYYKDVKSDFSHRKLFIFRDVKPRGFSLWDESHPTLVAV